MYRHLSGVNRLFIKHKTMKKHIIIPGALLIYAIILAYIGWDSWVVESGKLTEYIWLNVAELAIIVVLYFAFRYLDRKKRERKG